MDIVEIILVISLLVGILTSWVGASVWVARKLNRIDDSLKQLEPNGGDSFFDRVKACETHLVSIEERQIKLIRDLRAGPLHHTLGE